MKRCIVVFGLLTVFLFVSASAQALPTADEVLKMIVDKTGKIKTMESDMSSETKTPNGTMTATGHMTSSISGEKDKIVRKMVMTTKMTMQQGENTATQDMKTVSDGVTLWIEVRNSMTPAVQVMKMKIPTTGPQSQAYTATPAEQAEQLGKLFDFGAVTEDTVDGSKMYVLEATPKADNPQAKQMAAVMSKIRYYVDQKTLLFRRMVMIDLAGNEVNKTDMTNTKLDVPIDQKIFNYTPPEGAKVQEMTPPPAAEPDAPAPDAPAEK